MRSALKKAQKLTPSESAEWLRTRMQALNISGLEELAQRTGVDRGSVSRYFRQERVPKIDVIAPLAQALEVSPETLLIALGAIEKKRN
ncbi:MAG: helix-turn-helix transcriptional regulator [Actinobacteria bacterium]|nr:helix-turn-helix transcriptional regulator [Actinomycetota bacterium]